MISRRATNSDSEKVKRLIYSVLREYGLKPDPQGVDADLSDIESNYSNGFFEIYETEKGELLGSAALYPLSTEVCELRKMYLCPSARGQGMGKEILDRMIGKARELGFRRMELETASCLKEAISLYERYGFKPMSTKHLAERCDQAYFLDL